MAIVEKSELYKVGSYMLPNPTEDGVQIDHENMVSPDSGRTEAGYMHIKWVRPDVYKVHFTWKKLTGEEVDYIVDLMQGKEFVLTFQDRGQTKTINGYCGKVTYQTKNLSLHSSEGGIYTDIKANVEEM